MTAPVSERLRRLRTHGIEAVRRKDNRNSEPVGVNAFEAQLKIYAVFVEGYATN